METILDVPQGQFKLQRLPKRKNEILRAWDAADEYLLQYVFESISEEDVSNLLILNDSFGALAVALHRFTPTVISDSYLAQQATRFDLLDSK